MRFPCLRAGGVFFATCDHRTGDLIVKLPPHRSRRRPTVRARRPNVQGWALIGRREEDTWRALLAEARAYAR